MSFSFNPFIDNLDFKNEGGGGGGDVTINGFLGNTFTFSGQTAGASNTPVVSVNTTSGANTIEDRAWQTPYVVDATITVGLRATYTTIQAAINAAVADGMTFSNPRRIFLRTGTYVENLTIAGGTFLQGYNPIANNSLIMPVTIIGNHVIDALGVFYAENIQLQGVPGGDMLTGAGTAGLISLSNCILAKPSSGSVINISSNCTVIANRCFCIPNTGDVQFIIPNGNGVTFSECIFNRADFNVAGGITTFFRCTGIGTVNLDNSTINAYYSSFTAENNNINQPTGQGGTLAYCNFTSNAIEAYALSAVGTSAWVIQDCYILPNGSGPGTFLDPGTVVLPAYSTLGNVLQGTRVDDDYTTDKDNYIGVTDTTIARTIEILHNSVIDYEITVADESGNASNNTITIQDSAGGLINGQASVVIDSNYGSYRFHAIGAGNWIAVCTTVPANPVRTISVKDDFLGAYAVSLTMFSDQTWMNVSVGAGSISFAPVAAVDSEHAGIISSSAMDNSTNPDINLFMGLGSAGAVIPSLLTGGGEIVLEHIFRITTLSTGTNRYVYRVGLGDTRAADQQNGVYIEYTDNVSAGAWNLKTANGGARTSTNSSVPADTDWHTLKIIINEVGSQATYYLDGVLMGTVNTNMPTGPVTPFVNVINTAGAVSAGVFLHDAVFLTIQTTR